ncbi:MAG: NAD(P)-dependent oxidoreductase [Candidatus Woesebacteria bacterium]|nr:MAG: NAD(P)-dependent oxidoreductase [Candidatus Woesebacteria bacterium]
MKVLITGANGMLGTSVKKVFNNHDLIVTGSIELDVRNIKQVTSYASRKIDLILHLAAETDHFKAEFNPTDAYLTNHTGTQNMVELAKILDIPIVYIGTAGIFNGKKKIYSENDTADPINHYGRSKYYGEVAVKTYPKHYIIRSGWAMGGGPLVDKKFVNKIYKQIKLDAKKIYGISDVYGNPTYTMDFAKTLKNIVEKKPSFGTYNCPGKGEASRFEVLKEFVSILGLSKKIELIPVTYNEYFKLFPLQCPHTRSEVLSDKKLTKTGLSEMRDWHLALSEYAKEFKI